jgi:hypothetical protein
MVIQGILLSENICDYQGFIIFTKNNLHEKNNTPCSWQRRTNDK